MATAGKKERMRTRRCLSADKMITKKQLSEKESKTENNVMKYTAVCVLKKMAKEDICMYLLAYT